jgi:flavin-dependent dehydrogenase
MGGDPRLALAHLMAHLEIGRDAVVGRTGGPVPSGGPVERARVDRYLLVGDAAGHTHPITGAGVAAAVIGGTLAGQAAARASASGDLEDLAEYEREWASFMRGPLCHALDKRRHLDRHWSDDPEALSAVLRETWIAFKEYGRRRERKPRGPNKTD